MEINDKVFNHPANLYGDMISILFVSDVAYSGANFLNTQNIFILSNTKNISKWRQISGRIVRVNSHSLLPSNKRYAKIYTFSLSTEDKTEIIERFIEGEKVIHKLEKLSLFNKILNNSLSDDEKDISAIKSLFLKDLVAEVKNFIDRIALTGVQYWKMKTLIRRIQDSTYNLSFINFKNIPEGLIKRIIETSCSENVTMFNSQDKKLLRIRNSKDNGMVNTPDPKGVIEDCLLIPFDSFFDAECVEKIIILIC
jgi:hypothetical protein